ncbi:hypothetical protein HYH03_003675 [Edaphochlamys debaryana]|uniref:Uncharacterized protein n=1 Tax=Edaphochlamys debaryana TaxID=47281 RepID=A0A836C450_9CHLO|nr:hypothetical protein HYH03_003675 [Edaphochlamys debaryana]|eukprot:KAG2498417.1 hypothetical protein HYH03_003675 [Edaphochlamys debaryana]
MPGKFVFRLVKPERFDQKSFLNAIHETRMLRAPRDVYISYGPEDLGTALVLRSTSRQEWNLVLPTDPNKYPLECGFTYGITSRRELWEYVREILLAVCRSSPEAFELYWEDDDLGDVVEVGRFDPVTKGIVISHRGLPTAEQFKKYARVPGA